MSLLLDALKRAEQEKLARQAESPPPAPPHTTASMQAANAPNLELQPIASAAGVAPRSDAQAAQAVFDAKTAARPAAEGGKKGALLAALGAIAVIVIAAGAYVWYSIQTLAPKSLATAGPLRPPPAPTPSPASGQAPAGVAASGAPGGASVPGTVASAPSPTPRFEPSPAGPAPATVTPSGVPSTPPPRNRAAPDAAQKLAMELLRGAPAEAPVKLERSADAVTVPANISQGYAALRDGDLVAARRGYAAAVAADGGSIDARLGLATVEARAGNRGAANVQYRKALDLDPRNATALAGIASLADFTRPEAVEMQLRMELDRNPDSAALHLSLGNLYASQGRWSEAQRSFFEAHRLQAGSADTLYNLAVSLDHLGQARLAREYYGRALEAAPGQATQFEPALVSRRLAEMKP